MLSTSLEFGIFKYWNLKPYSDYIVAFKAFASAVISNAL